MKRSIIAAAVLFALTLQVHASPICSSCLQKDLQTADYLSAIATLKTAQGQREARLMEIAADQRVNVVAIELRRTIPPIGNWLWWKDMNALAEEGNELTEQFDDLLKLVDQTYENIDDLYEALDDLVEEINQCACKGT